METKQFNALMQIIAKLSSEVERLSASIDRLTERVDALERRVDALERRVDALEIKVDARFEKFEAEMNARFTLQDAVHEEILQAFNTPFIALEHDHTVTKTNHGKRISKLERHIG